MWCSSSVTEGTADGVAEASKGGYPGVSHWGWGPAKQDVLGCHTGDGFFVLEAQVIYFLDSSGTLGKPFGPTVLKRAILCFLSF